MTALAGLGTGIYGIVHLGLSAIIITFNQTTATALMIGAACTIGCIVLCRGYRCEMVLKLIVTAVGLIGCVDFLLRIITQNTVAYICAYAPPLLAAGIVMLPRRRGKDSKTQEVPPCE